MNKVSKFLIAAFVVLSPFAAMAQGDRPEPQRPDGFPAGGSERQQMPKMTAEQIAHQMTDRMDRMLTLTDKQYQKIYKINLKEVKEMEADSVFMSRRGGFGGPMGPGGPGMGPRPGGPGFGPGMRPPGMDRPEGARLSEEQMEQLRIEREKARLKKDKQLRKILSDEQYGIWIKAEQERLVRMREMQKRGAGPGGRGHRGMPPGGPDSRPDSTAATPPAPEQKPAE